VQAPAKANGRSVRAAHWSLKPRLRVAHGAEYMARPGVASGRLRLPAGSGVIRRARRGGNTPAGLILPPAGATLTRQVKRLAKLF